MVLLLTIVAMAFVRLVKEGIQLGLSLAGMAAGLLLSQSYFAIQRALGL